VLTLGLVVALYGLLASLRRSAARAPANPWGAATLEWTTASPPPHDNFEAPPRGRRPYDFTGLRRLSDAEGWAPGEETLR